MAAAKRFTFDPVIVDGAVTTPAARPSVEDVGGARFADPPKNPPSHDGTLYIYDDLLNQLQKQVAAMARMVPSARLTIAFSAGAPFISKLETMSSILLAADFTITDNSPGDTTISWAAGKLPPVGCDPMFSLNKGALSGVLVAELSVPTPTSVRLRTLDDGVAADIRFTVAIH